MAPEPHSKEQLARALERLSEPGALADAERLVGRLAPDLQRLLGESMEAGGWAGQAHADQARKAAAAEDPGDREVAVRTLLAEEARLAMFTGVAVGWALAGELGHEPPSGTPDRTSEE